MPKSGKISTPNSVCRYRTKNERLTKNAQGGTRKVPPFALFNSQPAQFPPTFQILKKLVFLIRPLPQNYFHFLFPCQIQTGAKSDFRKNAVADISPLSLSILIGNKKNIRFIQRLVKILMDAGPLFQKISLGYRPRPIQNPTIFLLPIIRPFPDSRLKRSAGGNNHFPHSGGTRNRTQDNSFGENCDTTSPCPL